MKKTAFRKCVARLLVIFVLTLGFPLSAAGVEKNWTMSISAKEHYAYAWKVLSLVNKERKNHDLSALKMDKTLLDAAMLRADESHLMFSHMRPNGDWCYTAVPEDALVGSFGENIAIGQATPEVVVQQWMNSPDHRANILNANYTAIGIGVTGVTYEKGMKYAWSQLFSSSFGEKAKKPKNRTKARKIVVNREFYPLSFRVCDSEFKELKTVNVKVGKAKQVYLAFKGKDSFFGYVRSPKSTLKYRVSPKERASAKSGKVKGLSKGNAWLFLSDGNTRLKKIRVKVTR